MNDDDDEEEEEEEGEKARKERCTMWRVGSLATIFQQPQYSATNRNTY